MKKKNNYQLKLLHQKLTFCNKTEHSITIDHCEAISKTTTKSNCNTRQKMFITKI